MKHIKCIIGHSLYVVYVLMRFNELPVLYSPTHDFQPVTAIEKYHHVTYLNIKLDVTLISLNIIQFGRLANFNYNPMCQIFIQFAMVLSYCCFLQSSITPQHNSHILNIYQLTSILSFLSTCFYII